MWRSAGHGRRVVDWNVRTGLLQPAPPMKSGTLRVRRRTLRLQRSPPPSRPPGVRPPSHLHAAPEHAAAGVADARDLAGAHVGVRLVVLAQPHRPARALRRGVATNEVRAMVSGRAGKTRTECCGLPLPAALGPCSPSPGPPVLPDIGLPAAPVTSHAAPARPASALRVEHGPAVAGVGAKEVRLARHPLDHGRHGAGARLLRLVQPRRNVLVRAHVRQPQRRLCLERGARQRWQAHAWLRTVATAGKQVAVQPPRHTAPMEARGH